jgi:hypothetical protein
MIYSNLYLINKKMNLFINRFIGKGCKNNKVIIVITGRSYLKLF